jgi:hypothetical protein
MTSEHEETLVGDRTGSREWDEGGSLGLGEETVASWPGSWLELMGSSVSCRAFLAVCRPRSTPGASWREPELAVGVTPWTGSISPLLHRWAPLTCSPFSMPLIRVTVSQIGGQGSGVVAWPTSAGPPPRGLNAPLPGIGRPCERWKMMRPPSDLDWVDKIRSGDGGFLRRWMHSERLWLDRAYRFVLITRRPSDQDRMVATRTWTH